MVYKVQDHILTKALKMSDMVSEYHIIVIRRPILYTDPPPPPPITIASLIYG